MPTTATFNPDWISPPGETITSILAHRRITEEQFADSMGHRVQEIHALLQGETEINTHVAQLLVNTLGSTKEFWLNREAIYRRSLERLHQASLQPSSLEWIEQIPTNDMVELGWLMPGKDKQTLVAACLRFFGVSDVASWRNTYQKPLELGVFRTSKTFASNPNAVAAWFRQGELLASDIPLKKWNPERFREHIPELRRLTRVNDPRDFIPQLKNISADCGLAVVILRSPTECKASGSCRFLAPGRPLIQLSARYLSDDHFWFTFFHETGHLLLHGEKYISVDEMTNLEDQKIKEESEANEFAQNALIPKEFQAEMRNLPRQKIEVIRFARKVGVSRGIVVGQLQHLGIIGRNQLNMLKHGYSWNEDNSLQLNP